MAKIQIKSVLGNVLFEYEKENNNLVDTIREADLSGASLREANLRGADLRGADLRGADLREADLREARNIETTEWFNQAKQNILYILSWLKPEVQNLKNKLIEGKINGQVYEGDCCCLIGSIGDEKDT
jgi:uncharacterized protein YjbI with pentapeptide repeats